MNRHLNKKGFTLVELLVALTLMSIGILAVVQMQIVALRSNTIAQKLTVATNIAQEVTNDIQSRNLADPVGSTTAVNVAVDFLTDPRLAESRNQTTLTFPDSGTFRVFYTTTLNWDANTAVNTVNVCLDETGADADARCGNVAGRRLLVGTTSFKRIV
ncbi:MAG: prepilin-type N-terminal cleavage/methylation domain-containing protein [Desulfuromonadaceae bacterium]|nr:prepilin-type N-terminal cleavage/methylation domain-containing protein [Desulfuromonadaceae bacterium]MDD2847852.1 prepilin-type N-terminal cleavage/methylation domain-containing protein [Desulfuromonadaceae bacterium]MDD4129603.1 prepilin-type N-terminal cleavage/methylation domain-containing protein [Desulfuromonadaceae bacterium]